MTPCRTLVRTATFLLLGILLPLQAVAPTPQGFPVSHHGVELFRISTGLGAFSAEERAKALEGRLAELDRNPFAPLPPLRVIQEGPDAQVTAGDVILFTVTEADAAAAGTEKSALAEQRRAAVEQVLVQFRPANRLKRLAAGAALALLASLAAWVLYRLIRRLMGALRIRLEPRALAMAAQLRFQDLELIPKDRARQLLNLLGGGLQILVLLVVGYAYLSVLFGMFPWTRGLTWRLFHAVLQPLSVAGRAILDYLPNLFYLAIIFLGTRYALRFLRLIFEAIQDHRLKFASFHPDWADPTHKLAKLVTLAIALVLAFPYLPGSGSEAFKGVSLFLGVIVSFGSSGAMGNVIAGVLLTYMRPFRIGDRVQIGDATGDVIERSALATRLRTIKNVEISIPNATILASQVHNYSASAGEGGLILHSTVTIGYDVPWRTVHGLLLDAAVATEGLLEVPAPFVLQTSLDDFYVSYQINAYTLEPRRMADLRSSLHQHIQEAFNRAGVEIMSPHYRALRDGNTATVPESHRPPDYRAPAFRVDLEREDT
ncbi:mechanosensitive ion channel family protein [Geothrix alkalitolerans]|uniref:mechanosensitive ion channel family protein n=1 Tax=Geothrix alkalitolerans TaxID=2922724 RepID=UPI001FAFE93F|nr:mechanosensitive ion channel family protein [Geothrix alkalitolerans]